MKALSPNQRPFSRNRRPRGMALVAVLWLIVILGFAAVTAISLLNFQLDVADSQINGFRARMAAEMGISVGCNPAVERGDPILQFTNEDGESYDVDLETEGGRFNINFLLAEKAGGNDKRLIKEIMMRWGIENDTAQEIADALMDWTDPNDDVQANGAELADYEKMGRLNQPFNRPFYSLDEVRFVRGWELVERVRPDWRDWFTVWSQGGLDVNEADAEKISIAAECNVEDADALVEIVRGADGLRGTEDDAPFQNLAAGENGPGVMDLLRVPEFYAPIISARLAVNDATVRIESIGTAGATKRKIILVVRNRAGKPVILQKTEEVIP
jgi:type II secretory pathway component PulK